MAKAVYTIERLHQELGWTPFPFVRTTSREYCNGYVDALDSCYPCDPLRIIKTVDKNREVVRETKGRSKVQTN